jgi:hypothetical protein
MSNSPQRGFNFQDCIIPEFWCGNGRIPTNKPNKRYRRAGTRVECLRKGFGAGKFTEIAKSLPEDSLQHIKYIGPAYETNFRKEGIKNLTDLVHYSKMLVTAAVLREVLTEVCTRTDGVLDTKAYNSVIAYLYSQNIPRLTNKLPACVRMT